MEITRTFSLLIPYRDMRSEKIVTKLCVKHADFLTFFSRFSHEKTVRILRADPTPTFSEASYRPRLAAIAATLNIVTFLLGTGSLIFEWPLYFV
jgi:hypothetical protein